MLRRRSIALVQQAGDLQGVPGWSVLFAVPSRYRSGTCLTMSLIYSTNTYGASHLPTAWIDAEHDDEGIPQDVRNPFVPLAVHRASQGAGLSITNSTTSEEAVSWTETTTSALVSGMPIP